MCKVSVLMPSLNVAEYMEQCLNSVRNQTLTDIEIICIDAGSTDGTLDVIKKAMESDKRIRLIESDKKSYGYQMNLGLAESKGEYVGIVETDDFASPDMFQKLYDKAIEFNAEIVKSNYYEYLTENGSEKFCENLKGLPYDKVICPVDIPELFARTKSIWSAIYKRSFLADNGICFTETPGASFQDIGFYLKTLVLSKRAVLVKDGYLHYRTDNVNSSVHSNKKVLCVCEEYASVEKILKEDDKRAEKYSDIITTVQAKDYVWNYNRIGTDSRPEFLARAQKDLQGKIERIDVSGIKLLPGIKGDIRAMVKSPEKCVVSPHGKLKGLYYCLYEHGLIYTIRYLFDVKMKQGLN